MTRHIASASGTLTSGDMSPDRRRPAPGPPVDQDLARLVQEARRGLTLATRAVEKIEARLRESRQREREAREDLPR